MKHHARLTKLTPIAACTSILIWGCATDIPGGGTLPPPLNLGTEVLFSASSIPAEGGTLDMNAPGEPVDGLVIEVPADAYETAKEFAVSYLPIISHDLPEGFEPVTPLIHIDNGGGYADDTLAVTIPIEINDDEFAMPFFYDRATGELEAIPMYRQSKASLTLATRHFSDVVVAKINISELKGQKLDSGYRPKVDDWQFTNEGAYASPKGNCSGMSLASMWYFDKKKEETGRTLYDYIHNTNLSFDTKTKGFTKDDDMALKLVTVVQAEIDPFDDDRDLLSNYEWGDGDLMQDPLEYYSIVAAMKARKKPVLIGVAPDNGGDGHALVCHRIDGNTLYVTDPNFDDDTERRILYTPDPNDDTKGKFGGYTSGANWIDILDIGLSTYQKVYFKGTTSLYHLDAIERLWAEMMAGTIRTRRQKNGDYYFPQYTILVREHDASGDFVDQFAIDLNDDNYTDKPLILLRIDGDTGEQLRWTPFKFDGYLPQLIDTPFALEPGRNVVGVYIEAMATWESTVYESGNPVTTIRTGFRWAGFEWFTIIYDDDAPPPAEPEIGSLEWCDAGAYITLEYDDVVRFDSGSCVQTGMIWYDNSEIWRVTMLTHRILGGDDGVGSEYWSHSCVGVNCDHAEVAGHGFHNQLTIQSDGSTSFDWATETGTVRLHDQCDWILDDPAAAGLTLIPIDNPCQ